MDLLKKIFFVLIIGLCLKGGYDWYEKRALQKEIQDVDKMNKSKVAKTNLKRSGLKKLSKNNSNTKKTRDQESVSKYKEKNPDRYIIEKETAEALYLIVSSFSGGLDPYLKMLGKNSIRYSVISTIRDIFTSLNRDQALSKGTLRRIKSIDKAILDKILNDELEDVPDEDNYTYEPTQMDESTSEHYTSGDILDYGEAYPDSIEMMDTGENTEIDNPDWDSEDTEMIDEPS